MFLVKANTVPVATISLTRATVASYFDSSGVMQSAAIDVPRFTYNPNTLAYEGILVENLSVNVCPNSSTVTNTTRVMTVASGATYTLSFYGTGTVVTSGANSQTIVGSGTVRSIRTFVTSSTSLTLTVTGTVTYVQVEQRAFASSWISTGASATSRQSEITTSWGIVYTSVTESVTPWSNATTYAAGDRVRWNARIWQATQATTNNEPQLSPTYWAEVGPNNTYAAFDRKISAVSTVPHNTPMVVAVRAYPIYPKTYKSNSVSVLGISADKPEMYPITVRVAIRDFDTQQVASASKVITDFNTTQVVFNNLAVTGDIVTVRIETTTLGSGTGTLSVQNIVFGPAVDLGTAQYGATTGIVDYSKKEVDEFGTLTLTERAFSKRMSIKTLVPNANLNTVQRALYDIRATPCLWVGSDDPMFDETLTVFGFYRDFSTDIAYPDASICNLEIEGLT